MNERTPFGDLQKSPGGPNEGRPLARPVALPRPLAHLGLRCPCFAWRLLSAAGAAAAAESVLAVAADDFDEIGMNMDGVAWRGLEHNADY